MYDPDLVKNMDFDVVVTQGTDTPVYRQLIDSTLLELLRNQLIDLEMYLEHSSLPFTDKLLSSVKQRREMAAQGSVPEEMPNELLSQVNENTNPKTYYWIEPRNGGNYGVVYFGFENFSLQGGINEKGLCFDANALPGARLNLHPELPTPPSEWVVQTILKKAATVEEAIDIAGHYKRTNWGIPLKYQIILADAKGDTVVISGGSDGELAFTRKKQDDGYLVSTNFNRVNSENAYSYPCRRYDKAVEMLEKIEDENDLTVDYFKSILEAVHVEGASSNTLYSNIFDLRNGIIYLYHWHQYDEVVMLHVSEQIARGKLCIRISDLFSKETVDKALDEYQEYREK